MLLIIAGILVLLWIVGLLVHIGGALIYLILPIAVIVVAVHFLR